MERPPKEVTMPTELVVHAVHQGGMSFKATSGEHSVTIDYPISPETRCVGMTPLQLLLTSLAACAGNTLGVVLLRMKQPFAGIEVTARGNRRDEHPTVITDIALEFVVRGDGIQPETIRRALGVAEDQLCPVWAMLKPGTPIAYSFKLLDE
jgi:putative redox protein